MDGAVSGIDQLGARHVLGQIAQCLAYHRGALQESILFFALEISL